MKNHNFIIFIPAAILGLVVIVILGAVLLLPSDTVITHFENYADANDSGAFERGWLPPILPPSAKNITEKNNLDLNIGEGSFTYESSHIDYFASREAQAIEVNSNSSEHLKRHHKNGYRLYRYSSESTSWLIAVHPNGDGAYWVSARNKEAEQ
jgi:hypothetical protein